MKRILCILLTLLLALSLFTACSSSGSGSEPTVKNVSGTYKLKSMNGKAVLEALREEMSEEELNAWLAFLGITADQINDLMKITLKEDGTCVVEEFGETGSGVWKLEGGKVTITIEDVTETGTWSNGVLKLTAPEGEDSDIQSMEFQKVS